MFARSSFQKVAFSLAIFAARVAFAQSQAFEVASIKPAAPSNFPMYRMMGGPGTNSPGQLTCLGITLRPLLIRAYDLRSYQLVGPSAIDGDKYDIVAKIPPGSTREQVNVMIQNLLAERFGIAVHRETRDLPVYDMTVTKGGIKMKDAAKAPDGAPAQPQQSADGRRTAPRISEGKDGLPEFPPGSRVMAAIPANGGVCISARTQTVANLLRMLESQIGRPVVDKTGLTGEYDFKMLYLPDGFRRPGGGAASAAEPPPGQGVVDTMLEPIPTLLQAFEGQLGLKLTSAKGPIEVLVVDRVGKPTED